MIDKSYRSEFVRVFLIDALPEPISPASAHVQIFDGFIFGTRMRIRRVRDPSDRAWTAVLQQRIPASVAVQPGVWKVAEMRLNESEYAQLESLQGAETRKNRYFYEHGGYSFALDVYLGELKGLTTARVEFQDENEMKAFPLPAFLRYEITADPFFFGRSLAERSLADVEARLARVPEVDLPPTVARDIET